MKSNARPKKDFQKKCFKCLKPNKKLHKHEEKLFIQFDFNYVRNAFIDLWKAKNYHVNSGYLWLQG